MGHAPLVTSPSWRSARPKAEALGGAPRWQTGNLLGPGQVASGQLLELGKECHIQSAVTERDLPVTIWFITP
jgi:hypothetical protein